MVIGALLGVEPSGYIIRLTTYFYFAYYDGYILYREAHIKLASVTGFRRISQLNARRVKFKSLGSHNKI